ncbi:hypothetical protein HQ535_11725 [bacterium]|nr:hypothetical protein [bacterium]
MRHRWERFLVGVAGVVVGALVISMLPVGAATGDPLVLGEANGSIKGTVMRTGGVRSLKIVNNRSNGTPLELVAQAGQPPLLVNSSTKVAGFNADLLDSRHANELIRVAYDARDDFGEGNSPGIAGWVPITAPRPGMLVMGGSVSAQGSVAYECGLWIDDNTRVPGTARLSSESCSTQGAVAVDKGTYYVKFVIRDRSATTTFGEAATWVMWVPFDGNGAVPTP